MKSFKKQILFLTIAIIVFAVGLIQLTEKVYANPEFCSMSQCGNCDPENQAWFTRCTKLCTPPTYITPRCSEWCQHLPIADCPVPN